MSGTGAHWLSDVLEMLRGLQGVYDAFVGSSPEGGKIVLYVVPNSESELFSPEFWWAVFEDCYEPVPVDGSEESAITGWVNSFTAEPFRPGEMDEWIKTTVDRISRLHPRRVVEVGSGTGMIMRGLVENCDIQEYLATDFSEHSVRLLDYLSRSLTESSPNTRITVLRSEATAPFDAAGGEVHCALFDTAVINSVVQYFPSSLYLESVIRALLRRMHRNSHIFLGDMRNSLLEEQFACLKNKHLVTQGLANPDRIRDRIAWDLAGDSELSIPPDYFLELAGRFPEITAVEVAPRRGISPVEMTLFRFDAVLHVGCPRPVGTLWSGWESGAGWTVEAIDSRLADSVAPFGLVGIANARLTNARRAWAEYREGGIPASLAERVGVDPEMLCRLGESHAREVRLRWSKSGIPGDVDVWFGASMGSRQTAAISGDEVSHFQLSVPEAALSGASGKAGRVTLAPRVERSQRRYIERMIEGKFPELAARVTIAFASPGGKPSD